MIGGKNKMTRKGGGAFRYVATHFQVDRKRLCLWNYTPPLTMMMDDIELTVTCDPPYPRNDAAERSTFSRARVLV